MSGRKRKSSFSSQGSPSKRAKLAEGLLEDPTTHTATQFTKGQITKISLTNWVTFDQAVIDYESGLNLIVGPNGTGKSAIVCAFALGLGGKPRSLGRGEKAADFIKFGREEAITKIELKNENGPNYEVIRVISKTGGSAWKLNGKKSTMSKVEQFVKDELNIKVDNLCQFLAQDRVSEFARLQPTELLIETEKAIEDDRLYKYHQFLIDEGEKADNTQNEIENLSKTLAQNQAEMGTLQKTIEQFESRKEMQSKMHDYQALHEWEKTKQKHKEYKQHHKKTQALKTQYTKKRANVQPLRERLAMWTKKHQNMNSKHTKQCAALKKLDKERMKKCVALKKVSGKITNNENSIKQAAHDLQATKKQKKKFEAEIEKLQSKLDDIDEEEVKRAKEEKMRIQRGDLKNLRNERNALDRKIQKIATQHRSVGNNLKRIEEKLANYKNHEKRKDDHLFDNRHRSEKKFHDWVESERHNFRGEVYGPIAKVMSVRDDQHALYLNNAISRTTFYGYVCTDSNDWQKLLRKSQSMSLQCTIFTSTEDNGNNNNGNNGNSNTYIRRPVDKETLHSYGVDGYLDEVFDAPDIIKKVLNDNHGLHQRAFAMRDINAQSLDNVLVTHAKQPNRLRNLIMPTAQFTVKESHYSANVLRSMTELQRHRNPILVKTPDYSQQIYATEQEKTGMVNELRDVLRAKESGENDKKAIVAQVEQLQQRKKEVERVITEYNKIKNQLIRKEKALNDLEKTKTGDNPLEIKRKLTGLIQKGNKHRIRILEKIADDIERLCGMMRQADAFNIARTQFEGERRHIDGRIKQIQKKHLELKRAYESSQKMENTLKRQYCDMLRIVRREFPRNEYESNWSDDDNKLSLDEIMDKINHLEGRINVLFIDPERVKRYKRLEQKISAQQTKLDSMENGQNKKTNDIKNIENKWKPQLQEAVDKISSKFAEFFNEFNKAEGKIELVSHNAEDKTQLKYSEWHIDILTKFRKDQPWKRLTSASQSGGEKSVCTMLYLLSLQQVTTVPFRVVDEINQGMDPINERRIMQILNYECTPRRHNMNNNSGVIRHLPQYFVVTPKLLPRLKYSPCSSVYVIFNGPFQMPQQYWKLNRFVQSQRALTASQANNEQRESSDDDDDDDDDDEETDATED